MSYNFHIYGDCDTSVHASSLFSESKCRTVLLESVANRTDHDQHVIHVFTNAHRLFPGHIF